MTAGSGLGALRTSKRKPRGRCPVPSARRDRRSAAFACLLLAFVPARAPALDSLRALSQYTIVSWQSERGLPQDTVQAILQTRDGFLWIGTQDGLARFDGVRFRTWTRRDTPALGSGSVTALLEDARGRLWIGLSGGIARRTDAGFTDLAADLPAGAFVGAFAETPDGDIWAATAGAGLLRYREDAWRAFTAADGLPTDDLRSICRDRDGDLWIATTGKGVVRRRGESFSVIDTSNGLSNDIVRSVVPDPAGGIWAGTAGGGLNRLTGGASPTISRLRGLPSEQVSALHIEEDGTLWVGTWGAGVARVRGDRVESLSSRQGLSNDQVWSLESDREGNTWVGTWVGGINRLGAGRFLHLGSREGLSSDNTRAVLETRDGVLWVATGGGGLNRVDNGLVTTLRASDGLPSDEVSALAEARDGSLLVGTYTAGACRVRGRRVLPLGLPANRASSDVRAILESRDGTVWIGTMTGLVRVGRSGITATTLSSESGGQRVISLLEDRAGSVWIGTHAGLFRRDLQEVKGGETGERFVRLRATDGLPSERVLTLHEDVEGVLWVGTSGGLARLEGGRFQSVTERDGLFDKTVLSLVDDAQGSLWLSCNRGLSRMRKKDLEAFFAGRAATVPQVDYGTRDGLPGQSFAGGQQPSGIRTASGRLVFPSYRGLVLLDPRSIQVAPPAHDVVIEEITAGALTFAGPGPIALAAGTHGFGVRYTAPNFVSPTSLAFRYQLEGVDAGPVEAGDRREVFYSNLGPGSYTFRVSVATHEGLSSPHPTAIVVRIAPRLVETWTFRFLLALTLGLLVFGLHRLRLAALRRRQEELERIVAARTAEIRKLSDELELRVAERTAQLTDSVAELESFAYTIAHDLKAPLRAIDGFAAILESDYGASLDESGRGSLAKVRRSAVRMGQLIGDLLEYSRLDRREMKKESLDLDRVVEAAVDSCREVIASSGAVVRFVGGGVRATADLKGLEIAVLSLLDNALKFHLPGRPAAVTLTTSSTEGRARLVVRDEGIGFDMAYRDRIFEIFQHLGRSEDYPGTGVGLALVRRAAHRMGGRVFAESAPGAGATFTLELPA